MLVNKSPAKLLAIVLVSMGDFLRGCCTSDVASFSTSDGNQGIAAMPYKFMPRAQAQGTAILAAGAPGSSRACKSDDSGSWHNPKNKCTEFDVTYSSSQFTLHSAPLADIRREYSMCYRAVDAALAFRVITTTE